MVHITTILHLWFPVDRERVAAGPTVGEDHLCAECAQTTLAANPVLNPRAEPLPTVGVQPVMLYPRDVRAFQLWIAKYHPRLKWNPPPNRSFEKVAAGGRLPRIRKRFTAAIARFCGRETNLFLSLLSAAIFLVHPPHANAADAIINWQGDAGYRARITMSCDDTYAAVLAKGDLSFNGPLTNQGITQLAVSFFSPSSLQPVFSAQDISNSIVTYRFLAINLDTTSATLSGALDVGKDSFAEGEPGSSAGQFYLTDYSAPSLIDSSTGQPVDSGGQFIVSIVPEPSALRLCPAALVVIIRSRRLRARFKIPWGPLLEQK